MFHNLVALDLSVFVHFVQHVLLWFDFICWLLVGDSNLFFNNNISLWIGRVSVSPVCVYSSILLTSPSSDSFVAVAVAIICSLRKAPLSRNKTTFPVWKFRSDSRDFERCSNVWRYSRLHLDLDHSLDAEFVATVICCKCRLVRIRLMKVTRVFFIVRRFIGEKSIGLCGSLRESYVSGCELMIPSTSTMNVLKLSLPLCVLMMDRICCSQIPPKLLAFGGLCCHIRSPPFICRYTDIIS